MQHYLFGQFKELETPIAPETMVAILDQARAARDALAEVPVRDIVELLDRVGARWRDPDSRLRQLVLDQLPDVVGFSPEMVARGLDELARLLSRSTLLTKLRLELGRPAVLDRWIWKEGYRGYLRAMPLGVLAHISPGNVFLGAADSLVHGLLTKNVGLLKVARGDPFFPLCFAQSLAEEDREGTVANSFAVLSFGRQDEQLEAAVKQSVDGIVVWGGAGAVNAWRTGVPPGVRVVEYGPRFSFALVTQKGLETKDLARSLALDTVMWEQRACASPQVLFLEEPGSPEFLEALKEALEELSGELPQHPLDLHSKIELLRERELARFGELKGVSRAWFPEGSTRWTVLERSWEDHHASPLNRCLVVIPFRELEQVEEWLAPHPHLLQSAGLGVAPHELRPLADRLAQRGVTRIVPLGRMHLAKHGAPHDGTFQLAQLVRLSTIETVEQRFDVGNRLAPDKLPPKLRRLHSLISFARNHSPYYQRTLTNIENLEDLPLLDAESLRQNTPPAGRDLLTGPFEGAYVFASGGSTGHPKFALYTYDEWEEVTDILASIYEVAGVRSEDTVANLFMAGSLWTSFLAASEALEKLGCVTLPIAGNSATEQILRYLELFRPTVLLGLPSILVALAETGVDLTVNTILYGGEHMTAEASNFLKSRLKATTVISAGYASVDAGPIGYQTPEHRGAVHRLLYDYQYLEFVDPDTGLPTPRGEVGEIVVTCLRRRLMPLIRYRTGDLGRWVEADRPTFELKGRIGDRLRVGTADIYPDDISAALDSLTGVSHLFQLTAERKGARDVLTLTAETNGSPPGEDQVRRAVLEGSRELAEAVEKGWLESFEVKLLPPGQLPRLPRTGKIKRVVDKR